MSELFVLERMPNQGRQTAIFQKDYVLSLVVRAMFNGLFSFVEKCMCN